ncbi:hemolysin family protein [Thermodesulfovibrio yellowstonii]|uniref:CBS domain protein n=1 Tax=Thermodesulfovibrio yellowstonii (strain ATCC 51303 / DSM 11347 / YP87) TaxID=289376 RepID=B5YFP5_THEYD|nr:hemolysin family protein [Thermodesulfovibrio yellowstonii]ACI20207.1 CBS domain protein [Thermodesulfovibrio yellowstonii DSM 11347]
MNEIFLIIFLIILNGFFAAAEIGVVTLRKTRLKQLIEEKRPNAEIVQKFKENPDKFLATIQVGITLIGSLASALAGAYAVKNIKPLIEILPFSFLKISAEVISIAIVVILVTYFSVVAGELIPKSIALSHPDWISLKTAKFIDRFSKLTFIFVKILTISTNFLLKPFGLRAFSQRGFISQEELKLLIEEGEEKGIFEPDERQLIHSAFSFAEITVKEIMVPAPQMVTVSIYMSVNEIKEIIMDEKFSRYPALGKDLNDIRGILHAKDFYNALIKNPDLLDIKRLLKPPMFVPETMKINILLKEMQKKRVHMAIVVDEYGVVTGLVTLEDILEELVGEIRDEYDIEMPVITLPDGSMIIDATISIRDLKEDYGIEIEESEEYDTLGGFILTSLQRIPHVGDTVDMDGKIFKVIEMVGQRISKIKYEAIDVKKE